MNYNGVGWVDKPHVSDGLSFKSSRLRRIHHAVYLLADALQIEPAHRAKQHHQKRAGQYVGTISKA